MSPNLAVLSLMTGEWHPLAPQAATASKPLSQGHMHGTSTLSMPKLTLDSQDERMTLTNMLEFEAHAVFMFKGCSTHSRGYTPTCSPNLQPSKISKTRTDTLF